MKKIAVIAASMLLVLTPVMASAGPDDRAERRAERGRMDERHERRDCRQVLGPGGEEMRKCRQETRDGVRGWRGNDDVSTQEG